MGRGGLSPPPPHCWTVKVAELQKAAAEGLCECGAATTALDEVVEKWEADEAN